MSDVSNLPLAAGTGEICRPLRMQRPNLRPDEASEVIEFLTAVPCSTRALATMRCRGNGPPFVRVRGRWIRYPRADLLRWCEGIVSDAVISTSEYYDVQ